MSRRPGGAPPPPPSGPAASRSLLGPPLRPPPPHIPSHRDARERESYGTHNHSQRNTHYQQRPQQSYQRNIHNPSGPHAPYAQGGNPRYQQQQRGGAPQPTRLLLARDELFRKFKQLPKECFPGLPPPEALFTVVEAEIDPDMKHEKEQANKVKGRLDDMDKEIWFRVARATNLTGKIVAHLRYEMQAEMSTIAFTKMFELLSHFRFLQRRADGDALIQTAHICEAPGAFIAATNHYLKQHHGADVPWRWSGLSLNPYYEGSDPEQMLDDDLLILYTEKHWCFGNDNSGNVMSADNLQQLKSRHPEGLDLISGDGGIDCTANPEEQEMMNAHLHYCEAVASLLCLKKGGDFILKAYTIFERPTVALLYLLGHCFEELWVTKPATSKAANSETYFVGVGYKGCPEAVLDKLLQFVTVHVPRDGDGKRLALYDHTLFPEVFSKHAKELAKYFSDLTSEQIEASLDIANELGRYKHLQNDVLQSFMRKTEIRAIAPADRLVTQEYLNGATNLSSAQRVSDRHTAHNDRNAGATLEDRRKLHEQSQRRRSALVHSDDSAASAASGGSAASKAHATAEEPTAKRHKAGDDGERVAAEADASGAATGPPSAPAPKVKSVAERMMESMGYKRGQGLGRSGAGRTEPVPAEQRPERAGLGTQVAVANDVGAAADGDSVNVRPPGDWPLFLYEDDPSDALHLRCHEHGVGPTLNDAPLEWEVVSGVVPRAVISTRFSRTSLLYALQEARLGKLPDVLAGLRSNAGGIWEHLPWLALAEGDDIESRHASRLGLLGRLVVRATPGLGAASLKRVATCGGKAAAHMAFGAVGTGTDCEQLAMLDLSRDESSRAAPPLFATAAVAVECGLTAPEQYSTTSETWRASLPPWAQAGVGDAGQERGATLVFLSLAETASDEAVAGPGKGDAEMRGSAQALQLLLGALEMCAAGGALAVRMGDMFTRHSAGLFYVLYRAFDRCKVVKPFLASGIGAERVVVCVRRHADVTGLKCHLEHALREQGLASAQGRAVLSFVPMTDLLEPLFLRHVVNVNERLAVRERETIAYVHSLLKKGQDGAVEESGGASADAAGWRETLERLMSVDGGAATGDDAEEDEGWQAGGVERF